MELLRLKCPVCHSSDMRHHSPYTTKNHGGRVIYKCETCKAYFSETKNTLLEGLKTPVSVIWHVIKARTEGMGLNAAARTFEKAKNTILAWERKFLDLHQVLFLYALVHEFLELVIEGDEAYTKVQKNVPPDQSPGWTILLMDRASRFIWELDCGKKDRKLFQKAIKSLDKLARQTHDLRIFTDGERRYGNLLFEICHELVKNGKPGRPKKTFKRGVHFSIKNSPVVFCHFWFQCGTLRPYLTHPHVKGATPDAASHRGSRSPGDGSCGRLPRPLRESVPVSTFPELLNGPDRPGQQKPD